MLNVRVIRGSQFIHGDHDGSLDFEETREALCTLLAEGAEEAGHASGSYDLLFDVRDAEIQLSMPEVWALLEDLDECDPGFDGRLALLDDWDQTFDRVQFFQDTADEIGLTARAFIDFEAAVNWLWESRNVLDDA